MKRQVIARFGTMLVALLLTLCVLASCSGKDSVTPTIEISEDGFWIINGVKTEYKAIGTNGKDGINGTNGVDGSTPIIEISSDGYWVINDIKTDVKATSNVETEENSFGLQFELRSDYTYSVSWCDATSDNIVIPATYKGRAVVDIGKEAFCGLVDLTSITIPASVKYIHSSAFNGCTSLASITVDKNNTSYKDVAGTLYSKNGKTLIRYAAGKTEKNITIPNDVTDIGANAFYGCTNLISITIPNSVTGIYADAFYDCTSLTDVYYTGSEDEWKQIHIVSGNYKLTNATIHYNYVIEE